MNPGSGFKSHGRGFSRFKNENTQDLAGEVGEGHGSTFGFSKSQQVRSNRSHAVAQLCTEVGEGRVSTFGKSKRTQADDLAHEVGEGVSQGFSKAAQTRNAGKFQDEVGEGTVAGFGKRRRAIVDTYKSDRQRKMPTIDDPARFKWGEEVGEGVAAMPKPKALRNQAVMDSARGRMCLLQAPYTMHHDPATTVACHGNWSDMEKGGGRKADDCYIVWGCFECHAWLDQGNATQLEKRRVHALGMFRQMLAWEQMAVSETEPVKFRNAARWALDHLEAAEYDPRAVLMELDEQQANSSQVLELDPRTGRYLPTRQDD